VRRPTIRRKKPEVIQKKAVRGRDRNWTKMPNRGTWTRVSRRMGDEARMNLVMPENSSRKCSIKTTKTMEAR